MSEGLCNNGYFFPKVALLGTGLIGGSIGIALRERRLVENIIGYDSNQEACLEALKKGALDKTTYSAVEAVRDADLVILAVPVLSTLELLKEILPAIKKDAVVTDVGSSKGWIMEAVEKLMPGSAFFIGGHPMAGSEENGINGADPALLENAIYVLTPCADAPEILVSKLLKMFEETGAQPLVLDPATHDRVVAYVSHLPHMTAAALVQSVAGSDDMELVRTLAAGGFRDSTRIALGNPELWRDICISNRQALSEALKVFRQRIDSLQKYLEESNDEAVEEYLQQARDYRKNIPHRGKGILPELYEIVVLVRDTPGVIGHLAGLLGDAGINIDAIEILHVRELAGGSIRLGFRKEDQQKQALDLLNQKGFLCHSKE
ncbi:MAG: prephenate dehydrogenase [Bacillota bacterium]